MALTGQSSSTSVRQPVSPEYIIKAAYIYNFAMFVEWPVEAFSGEDAPIVIGILGSDPFGSALDATIRNKKVNNKRLVVKRVQTNQECRECHILFINSTESSRIEELAHRLKRAPILLVGETPDFALRGGMINFTIEENKVRCEINVKAAKRAGLTISSKLLSLSRIVDEMY